MDYSQPQDISVFEPVGAAIEKTKEILFRPFDIAKWFTIGFCAWLATLGESGGFNANFGASNRGDGPVGQGRNFNDILNNTKDYFYEHLPVILAIGAAIILIFLILTLVVVWLKSRGMFMFMHCVARNAAEVSTPWKYYAPQANSLFLFKLCLWIIGMFGGFVLMVPFLFILMPLIQSDFDMVQPEQIILMFLLISCLIVFGLTMATIISLTKDFVVPIMYIRRCTALDGWRHFWALLKANIGKFTIFLLFLTVVNIVLGLIIIGVILITCCCAACIFIIPYIGTVAMLPILVWRRAYSALYLAQYGPAFNVFPYQEPITPTNPGIPGQSFTPDTPWPPQPPERQY